jgi:hypothetical protein
MAIAAVFAELRGGANAPSLFIIGYRENPYSLMISLCPGCHAKVGRTKVVLSQMPSLLLELWREQHPLGHEQTAFAFKASFPVAKSAPQVQRNCPREPLVLVADYTSTCLDQPREYCLPRDCVRNHLLLMWSVNSGRTGSRANAMTL